MPNSTTQADDDPELEACYRHPNELTALSCVSCDRPICVNCMVQAAVGVKCTECARMSRKARGLVPPSKIAFAVVTAGGVGSAAAWLLWFVQIPFLGLILAYFAGAGVGALARKASGGFRDNDLARSITATTLIAFLIPIGLYLLASPHFSVWLMFRGLAAVLAAVGAFQRAQ